MGIDEIEQAIKNLTPKELAFFRKWYESFDAQEWDRQFEDDVHTGKLKKLADKAIEEYRAGKSEEL